MQADVPPVFPYAQKVLCMLPYESMHALCSIHGRSGSAECRPGPSVCFSRTPAESLRRLSTSLVLYHPPSRSLIISHSSKHARRTADAPSETIFHGPEWLIRWRRGRHHSGGTEANPGGDRNKVQPYRRIDDLGWIEKCQALCGYDPILIRKIWTDNPRRLWDYEGYD